MGTMFLYSLLNCLGDWGARFVGDRYIRGCSAVNGAFVGYGFDIEVAQGLLGIQGYLWEAACKDPIIETSDLQKLPSE